jgi:hypothetical protein
MSPDGGEVSGYESDNEDSGNGKSKRVKRGWRWRKSGSRKTEF